MDLRKNRNEIAILCILLFVNLVLKIVLRNASLSQWDDVEYSWRVQHGTLYAHTPGYPGYMVLGRAFYLFTSFICGVDSGQAMILLSTIFGGLLVIPIYLLIRTLLGKKEAIIGALFVMLNPLIAEMSAQAMSDIISVFFITLAVSLLYFGLSAKNNKIILLSSVVFGFSVAIRLTNFMLFPFFVVATFSNMSQFPNRKAFFSLFLSILVFFSAIAYIPLVIEKGISGFIGFLTEYNGVNAVSYTFETMKIRTLVLTNDLISSVTPIACVFCLIGIYVLFLKRKVLFRDLLIWIIAFILLFLLYGNPTTQMNRYILPVYPALAVLFSYGLYISTSKLNWIIKQKKVKVRALTAYSLIVIVFASIVFFSLPTYQSLTYWSENQYPTKPIALWINQTVPANSTIIGGSFCWILQYYLDLPIPTPRLIWDANPSWITYATNKSLANGNPVFIVSERLESYKFLTQNFDESFYARYNETLLLYEITPKSA